MMKRKQEKYLFPTKSSEGFSLLEVLLVVGVLTALALGIVELTNSWVNQEKNLSAARHLRIIHNAAESYIRDNFNNIMLNLVSGTGVLEIPIDDAGGSVFFLKEGNTYLPASFRATNSHGQTVTVLVRDASLSADVEDQRIEAVVVTSGRPMTLQDAIDAAQATGSVGGIIAGIDTDIYGTNDFGSVYGTWMTSLTNYAGLLWDDINIPLDSDRAHLAAFIEMNYKNVVSDYLYRVEIPGLEEVNRMQANLDMNSNSITNAARLLADRVDIGNVGSLDVQGNMSVDGGIVLEGDVTVVGGLFVEDAVDFGSLLAQNDVIVQGNITTQEIDVAGTLSGRSASAPLGTSGAKLSATTINIDGGLTTMNLNAVSLEMNNGTIDINGTGTASIGEISNVSLINAGAIGASTIRGSTIDAGALIVNQPILIDGNVVFDGTVDASGSAMAIGTLQNCLTVQDGVCQ